MKIDRTTLLVSTALALLPLSAAAAQAPTPASSAPPATDPVEMANTDNSEEIIVTAQKREQTLVDIPQSITVVSGATLEQQQATNFQDYLKLVPGLQLDQSTPGAGRLILRGLNTGGVASTVAVYVDETPFGSSTALANGGVLAGDFDTFDVARIEVLRGPQGTLYGANSLGGLIKFVTNAPDTSKLEARGRLAIEDTKGGAMSYRGNAVINIPINDMIAVRATGFYNKLGGFIDSIGTSGTDAVGMTQTSDVDSNINDSKSYGGRVSALFKPNDTFDLRLTAFLQDIHNDAPSTVESDPNTLHTRYGRPSQSQFAKEFTNVNYRVYNGLFNYDFGFATLTASSSYSTQKQSFRNDATFALSGFTQVLLGFPPNDFVLDQHTNNRRYTEEVRLTSAKNDFFEWLVGGYYTDEKSAVLQQFVLLEPGTETEIETDTPVADVALRSRYKEYAGFANATLHLGERFDLDFGARYSHNKQRASQTAVGTLAGSTPVNSNLRSSDNVFTYAVAPKFKISDRASVYARVAKGYRPGGPNAIPPDAPAGTPATFGPDTVVSYEAGFKGETDDRTFALDFALYHIDWKNIQLITAINNFGVNINGGKAKSDGFELTATVRPTPGFEVSFIGAYTRARLTKDAPPLVGGEKGDRLPFTPPYTFTVDTNYSWAIGEAKPFVGASLRFLSDQSGDFDAAFRAANGRQRKVPSYDVVDLRAGVDFGRFGIEAFVRNLTNSGGKTSTGTTTTFGLPANPNGSIDTGIIRPRTIGLSVNAGF